MVVLQRALDLRPDRPAAWALMGKLANASGDSQAAIRHLESALRIDPNLLLARRDLFSIYRERGETKHAIEQLHQILHLAPTDFFASTQLAWIHATSGDPAYRDGPRALMLAGQACRGVDDPPPICLDTTAAALAENRRFPEAMELTRRAIQMGNHEKAEELALRLQLYEAHQPYREHRP
jgi:tetratricopeptide (TPR) repeat protein